MAERADDNLHVVFMCTGNQARSVLAEHYLRKAAADLPLRTESVGMFDAAGAPALEGAVVAGNELGLDLSSHASRSFQEVDLSQADLVIGFEQQHVATAVVDGNAPPDKTFKLIELERLLSEGGAPGNGSADGARTAVARAAGRRAQDASFRPGEDISDPIGKDTSFFRTTADEIRRSCEAILRTLFSGPR